MTTHSITDTRLTRAIAPLLQEHPGLSGVFALPDGRDAFAVRVLLADAADRSIDAQYYIWHNDMSGMLLFSAVYRAAERGVRVRLLLDDNTTAGMDRILAAVNTHPNIHVRLFNPFRFRRWRVLNYLTDFARLNRRMHNKSFTVDRQATVIGGRNIGDEYFDTGQGVAFADLDVLAIGPAVDEVSDDFERYWTCASAHPADRVLPVVGRDSIDDVVAAGARVERDPAARAYSHAVASSAFVQKLLAHDLAFEWAVVHMVSDDPAKGLGRAPKHALLSSRFKEILGRPTQELHLISPYFVPGGAGVEFFSTLATSGVQTAVLTNSLEATDVPAVHAGYAKRRKPLLKAGVTLHEMKRTPSTVFSRTRGPGGSSDASLHAKTFSSDGLRVFVGSFNFDPRSAKLNTEMGFIIDSPTLARQIADALAQEIPARTYKLRQNESGALEWLEWRDGQQIVHRREPGASLFRRIQLAILSVLPIEWLL